MKICPQCETKCPASAEFCPRDGTVLPEDDGQGTGTRMLYDPLIGELIDGRYKVETRLGEGALSTVYAATHELIEKRVALKVLKQEFVTDEEIVERFLREAKAASRLSHENIISLSDFGKVPSGAPFFVMELLDGRMLSDVLYEGKGMPIPEAVRIVTEIGRGLAAAHQHGVVHRDLKPDNIGLVRDDEGTEHVKILDFGLAKITQENRKLTRAGQVLGTPEYMSPEQASGQSVDHRSDVFSLGILLFRLVTGRVPFQGRTFMAVISKVLSESPPAPRSLCDSPELTVALEEVILRALARSPADRYPTMDALLEGLRRATGGLVVSAQPMEIEAVAQGAVAGEVDADSSQAVASTWVDPGPPAEEPPSLEDQATGPTAIADVVSEDDVLGQGPTEAMPSVLEGSTVPDLEPPANMPPVSADSTVPDIAPPAHMPAVRVQPPVLEDEVEAATELQQVRENLRLEQQTAEQLIRRSAENRSRQRVYLISATVGLLGIAAGVVLAIVLSGETCNAPGPSAAHSSTTAQMGATSVHNDSAVKSARRTPPDSGTPPLQRRRPALRTIRFEVRSTPAKASVYLDSKLAGHTPLSQDLPAGPRAVLVAVVKPGYQPHYRKIRPQKDTTITVLLIRARPRPMDVSPMLMRPRPMGMRPGPLRDLKDPFAPMKP